MSTALPEQSGYEFPCEIPLVAFGPAGDDFVEAVERALIGAGGSRTATAISARASSAGRWQAVKVPLWVADREQLEALYAALVTVPGVKFKL